MEFGPLTAEQFLEIEKTLGRAEPIRLTNPTLPLGGGVFIPARI